MHARTRTFRVKGSAASITIVVVTSVVLAAAIGMAGVAFVSAGEREWAVGAATSDVLPPDKQTVLARGEYLYATALSQPTPAQATVDARISALQAGTSTVPSPTPFSPFLRESAGAGTIVEDGQAPFSEEVFVGMNHWWEARSNENVIVYAGANGQDRAQGMVIVSEMALDDSSGFGEHAYPTPKKMGSVHVVTATGELLTLSSANGATFVFDVAARTFVS